MSLSDHALRNLAQLSVLRAAVAELQARVKPRPVPVPTAPQRDPAVAQALFAAWEAAEGTPEEEAAFRAVTLHDVAHLEGAIHRPHPTTRPEARP